MSDDLLQRTDSFVRARRLFSPGQKILVAVSGGADSIVLLYLLHSLAPEKNWQLSVAHFNHQLRGRASDADEQLVRRTAKAMKLPCFVGRADVKRAAARSKISIEMAARNLRHAFFARVARRQKIRTAALAHHADDQVELFFLRILRGAGGAGVAGMLPLAPSPVEPRLILVRPLLEFSKSELLDYARVAGLAFREDASNQSNDHLRNRIRNELLPLLRKNYQPGLNATVLRLMEIVGAESTLAAAAARQWRKKKRVAARTRRVGAGGRFTALPVALQRKVMQQQLIDLDVASGFELVETLRESTDQWVNVRTGLSVSRDDAGIVRLRKFQPFKFNADELEVNLSNPAGEVTFADRKFYWELKNPRDFGSRLPRQFKAEFFDADKVGARVILRHWRTGDRFQPIGMASSVKLQDLFVNAKIPVATRHRLILATTRSGEIFWVENLRIAEPFKLTAQTRRRLVWRWSG